MLLTDTWMSELHEDLLLKNLPTIADKLSCIPQVLNELVAAKIINTRESEDLLSEKSSLQATRLVYCLTKREDLGFSVFVESLRATNQNGLADLLYPGDPALITRQ